MTPLPAWMRVTLFATAAMNLLGAFAFLPGAQPLRDLGGFPRADHPLYLCTVGIFIFALGLGYLGCAIRGSADRLFIAIGALGKLAFFALLAGLYASGDLPLRAPLSGAGDLAFGLLFVIWLAKPDHHA